MLRLVAPSAFRNPISFVRSVTVTSMMLIIPTAPNASVTFRYRILISSAIAAPEATEGAYKDFVAAYH